MASMRLLLFSRDSLFDWITTIIAWVYLISGVGSVVIGLLDFSLAGVLYALVCAATTFVILLVMYWGKRLLFYG